MAITKYNLFDPSSNSNSEALCLAFLRETLIPDWLGADGTVTKNSDNQYVLTDSDENVIAVFTNRPSTGAGASFASAFYTDDVHTVSYSGEQYTRWQTGYKTAHGIMILTTYADNSNVYKNNGIIILSKTNNGKLAMAMHSAYNTYQHSARDTCFGVQVAARDDDYSDLTHTLTFAAAANDYGQVLSQNENQTILCPTPTHSNPGETSIIEGVFMMPWAQYRNEGIIQLGNKYYATNGYWALED